MPQVTCDITTSLDGYVAGPDQSLEKPFGDGPVDALHRWMLEEPERHSDVLGRMGDAGAVIMGRNMFGPGRGAWDMDWQGWWGEEPPYHAPVFVLTHHPRDPLPMHGGTTFHFVTDGFQSALAQAREAAGDRNIAIAGGAHTINTYLAAGLIDELRLHIAPVILGRGERLFDGVKDLDLAATGSSGTELVTHITYRIEKQA